MFIVLVVPVVLVDMVRQSLLRHSTNAVRSNRLNASCASLFRYFHFQNCHLSVKNLLLVSVLNVNHIAQMAVLVERHLLQEQSLIHKPHLQTDLMLHIHQSVLIRVVNQALQKNDHHVMVFAMDQKNEKENLKRDLHSHHIKKKTPAKNSHTQNQNVNQHVRVIPMTLVHHEENVPSLVQSAENVSTLDNLHNGE